MLILVSVAQQCLLLGGINLYTKQNKKFYKFAGVATINFFVAIILNIDAVFVFVFKSVTLQKNAPMEE